VAEWIGMVIFPQYGALTAGRELIGLAPSMEHIAHEMADSFIDINDEIVATRSVVVQNRMALDLFIVAKGSTCTVIGSECCTYIPDRSEHITDLTAKIR